MNIVLLNPRLKTWSPNASVPLGLCYVAAALEKAGYGVSIIDLNVQKGSDVQLKEQIAGTDIVGITGMITEYEAIVRLVGVVRGAGKAKIVLGGPLATTLPREILQESGADVAVIGEGERTIVELTSAMEKGSGYTGVKGIAYISDGQVKINEPQELIADLDAIAFPARHLLDTKRYFKDHFESFGFKVTGFGKIKSTNVISSRGCPYSCTFCFKEMWGFKWRHRSPANIIDEMESLHKAYGINGFFFNDDTFTLDRDRVFEFCRLLKERGLKVAWYGNGRVNLMTKELLEAMYSAGCRGIAYGIESGNQRILDSIKKNITLDQVRKVVKWTKEAGINVTGYFMIGILGEKNADIRETMAFARELKLDFYGFSLVTPLPGTELYNQALQAGLIDKKKATLKEWSQHVNANLTYDTSNAELAAFASEAFKEFYLKKRFGEYYFVNPVFIKAGVKTVLAIRNREQARELVEKVKGLAGSYWNKK